MSNSNCLAHERPAAERQAQIAGIVIEYDRYLEAFNALGQFHLPVRGGTPAVGKLGILFGSSRAGKTFVAKRYADQFPLAVGEAGVIRRVLRVDMPLEGSGGPRGILDQLADGLGLVISRKMNNVALFSTIARALTQQKVELIIFDEFEQVFREKGTAMLTFGRGLLRKLLNLGSLSIVCIGLENTYKLLKDDPQLFSRGGLPNHEVRAYDWQNQEERKDFRLLCNAFDKRLPFKNQSNLGATDLAYRLYRVTDGNIGRLKGLLEDAGALAINIGSDRIELDHFAQVYEARKEPGTTFNWFVDDPQDAPKSKATGLKTGSAHRVFSKHSKEALA